MRSRRSSWGERANRGVHDMASRVDGRTTEVAQRAAGVIALAARVLRVPTLLLLLVPLPFELATLALALQGDGAGRTLVVVLVAVMAALSATFAWRRRRILWAVQEPDALATELGIAVSLSDKVDETRGALERVAGGGGARVFSRLGGLWSGVGMTGRWIDGVGDLPRARCFVPPRVGTTVTVAVAALWLVPVSVVVTLLTVIASVSSAL